MSATDLGIGEPPKLPTKEAIKFIACAENHHGECVRESATQRCSCVCHTAALEEPMPELEAEVDLDAPEDTRSVDEIVADGTTGEVRRATVDGKEAVIDARDVPQEPEPEVKALIHDLVVARRRQAETESEMEDLKAELKDRKKAVDELVIKLCKTDAPGEQLAFAIHEEAAGDE